MTAAGRARPIDAAEMIRSSKRSMDEALRCVERARATAERAKRQVAKATALLEQIRRVNVPPLAGGR